MNVLSEKDDESVFLYDENFKKTLQKTKLIDKRIEDRRHAMRQRLTQLKNVCRIVRFHQLIPQPQSPDLPSLDSKVFTKSSGQSVSPDKDEESAKDENIKISKEQAKLESVPQKKTDDTKKQAKLQYQPQTSHPPQDNHQIASTANKVNTQIKNQYEPQRVDMSAVQRSENSTAKFVDSEKQSSFILKGPFAGQDQSFIGQTQELEKTKNTNSFQSTFEDRNFVNFSVDSSNNKMGPLGQLFLEPSTQTLGLFNPQIFTFSSLPQNQVVNIQLNPNWQAQKIQEVVNIPVSMAQNSHGDKYNRSVDNLTSVQAMVESTHQRIDKPSEKLQNEPSLLKSVDKSMAQSAEDKSLSFHQIYDQLDNFFRVNSSQETPNKPPQPQIGNAPVKQPPPIDLSKLQVNPSFLFGNTNAQRVMPKTKNRLFKGRGNRRNSSDNQDSD